MTTRGQTVGGLTRIFGGAVMGVFLAMPADAQSNVILEWDGSPDAVQGYKVYSKLAATGEMTVADVGGATSAVVSNIAAGKVYQFYVTAYDTNRVESDPSNAVDYTGPQTTTNSTPTGPRFLQADTSTRGNWKGVYGRDGYWIARVQPQLPIYADVTTTNLQWTWSQTTYWSAPYLPGDSTNRIAACWYSSTGLDFRVTIKDGQYHRVSIYMLDWTASGRRAQVDLVDLRNGAIVDSRLLTNYAAGIYLTWEVTGAIGIRVTPQNVNAVVSAIFFDPSTSTNGSGSGQVNRPPTLQPIANQVADEGRALQIALQGADPDPGQTLRYTLGTNAPTGAAINTTTGAFTWTPTATQAPSTNQVTLIATDSGSPAMSASQTFTVVVRAGAFLTVSTAGTLSLANGTALVNPMGTLNSERTKYIYGTSVSATAQPQTGSYFSHWVRNGATYTQNPLTFSMTGNQSLTAHFGVEGGGINLASDSISSDTLTAAETLGSSTESITTLASTTTEPTYLYSLESSTNLVEWTAVTNVLASAEVVDANSVFRIRAPQ